MTLNRKGHFRLAEAKTIKIYLLITFSTITPVALLVFIAEYFNFPVYDTPLGFIAISVGGISTALAGAVSARKTQIIDSYLTVLKDFFGVIQPIKYYLLPFGFLLLMFGFQVLGGSLRAGMHWYNLPMLFCVSILFGGIEEIGWRYVFQPTLEKRFSFIISSFITFGAWSVWHIMYFVIDGSIRAMDIYDILIFLAGLLGTSFVLGCIYRITKSLWLCVLYHALLNACTQTFADTNTPLALMVITVVISIILVYHDSKKEKLLQ